MKRLCHIVLAMALGCSGGGGGGGSSGGVAGPTSTTDGNLAAWNGTGGTALVDSGVATSGLVSASRAITAGTGLTGGGALSADRTIALSTTDNQALTVAGTLTAASGLTVATGNLGMTQGFTVHTLTSGITACTTQAQGQCPLTSDVNGITISGTDGDTVTLPAIPSSGSRYVFVIDFSAAHTVKVFPASGASICATGGACLAANASITLAKYLAGGSTLACHSVDSTNWGCSQD